MRKRPLKLLPLSLKKSLKRNRAFLFIFLFISQFQIYSDDFQTFTIEYNLNHQLSDKIEEAVEKNDVVEVILQTRVYRVSDSSISFLDKQIFSSDSSKTISKDIFSELYLIKETQGNKYYFDLLPDAIEKFLHLGTKISPQFDLERKTDRYYLKKRAILILKVYNEPFSIFQFIDKGSRIVTNWKKDFLP